MLAAIKPSTKDDICIWHGDFHFANILFDFRSQRVKVVDPRGMLSDGTITMFGDARYDISKLVHSVVGMYDSVLAGRYILATTGGTGSTCASIPTSSATGSSPISGASGSAHMRVATRR
jgi:hypothetical protein